MYNKVQERFKEKKNGKILNEWGRINDLCLIREQSWLSEEHIKPHKKSEDK